jgi:hypothetical protein
VAQGRGTQVGLPWFASTAAIAFAYVPLFAIVLAVLPAIALLHGHVTIILLWVIVVALRRGR